MPGAAAAASDNIAVASASSAVLPHKGRALHQIGELLVPGPIAAAFGGAAGSLLGPTSISRAVLLLLLLLQQQLRSQEQRLGEAGGLVAPALYAQDSSSTSSSGNSSSWSPRSRCRRCCYMLHFLTIRRRGRHFAALGVGADDSMMIRFIQFTT
jgi:hypothetical protein